MIKVKQHGPVRGFSLARTILGKGRYYTACWWLDGCLIDSGCLHTVAELDAALAGLPLHTIVNTHAHEDHVAGNQPLARARGARVLAPAPALAVLRGESPRPPLMPYQRLLWGWPQPGPTQALGELVQTPRHTLRVVRTPGHSPEHVVFFEPDQGWLFCGDAYVGGRERSLRRGYDIWGIINSLRVMRSLRPSLIFTGSGSMAQNPEQALAAKLEYLEEKAARVAEYHQRGWSVRRIRRKLFGPQQAIHYITQGDFSGEHLVRSFLDRPGQAAQPA